jgi:hypothetical protein
MSPSPDSEGRGLDDAANGRAEAAYNHEFGKWQQMIEAVRADRSLSPDQRAAAVFALRIRQRLEAKGARKRVLEDEVQKAQTARRAQWTIRSQPTP